MNGTANNFAAVLSQNFSARISSTIYSVTSIPRTTSLWFTMLSTELEDSKSETEIEISRCVITSDVSGRARSVDTEIQMVLVMFKMIFRD